MADTYITTAFEIRITADEALLLGECFEAPDDITNDFPDCEGNDLDAARAAYEMRTAAFKAAFPPMPEEADPFATFLQFWSDPDFPTFDARLSIEDEPGRKGKLAYVRGESADVLAIAALIQKVCRSALPFGFTWAVTCSRMLPGSFGGGYFLITSEEIQGGSTERLLSQARNSLRQPVAEAAVQPNGVAEDRARVVLAAVDEIDGSRTRQADASAALRS